VSRTGETLRLSPEKQNGESGLRICEGRIQAEMIGSLDWADTFLLKVQKWL
jgi:hypothetical protein